MERTSYTYLVPWFWGQPPRDTPLLKPLSWGQVDVPSGFQGAVSIIDWFWQATTPRALGADRRLKHTFCLSVKEAHLLVQELWSIGQASSMAHI